MKFYQLALGSQFTHFGQQYTKVAIALAEDSQHQGHTFMGCLEVEPVGEPLLLPREEAAKWRPDYRPWNEILKSGTQLRHEP
jgi:hypothetical protein